MLQTARQRDDCPAHHVTPLPPPPTVGTNRPPGTSDSFSSAPRDRGSCDLGGVGEGLLIVTEVLAAEARATGTRVPRAGLALRHPGGQVQVGRGAQVQVGPGKVLRGGPGKVLVLGGQWA